MGESKRYHSPARAEQARQNRRAILDAAQELFLEQGYGATTLEQIADRAQVSKPTVFNAVGNKVAVFRTVRDLALNGEGESPPDVAGAPDLDSAIKVAADYIALVCRRYHPIHVALGGAAGTDAAMADMFDEAELERHDLAGRLLAGLGQHTTVGARRARVQDRLWLLMAPDNYARLVGTRQWSHRAYRAWLAEAIRGLLA